MDSRNDTDIFTKHGDIRLSDTSRLDDDVDITLQNKYGNNEFIEEIIVYPKLTVLPLKQRGI